MYLSIRSAYKYIQPDIIYFHSTIKEMNSYWWHKSQAYITIKDLPSIPYQVNDNIIYYAAHQSDFIRNELLLQYGGKYMEKIIILIILLISY